MNLTTPPLLPLPIPAVLSTTTADTHKLMKQIDNFIKVKVTIVDLK